MLCFRNISFPELHSSVIYHIMLAELLRVPDYFSSQSHKANTVVVNLSSLTRIYDFLLAFS